VQSIETVGVEKVCENWVLRILTDAHKEPRKIHCAVNSWHSSPDSPSSKVA
jgi:hypothetical protein